MPNTFTLISSATVGAGGASSVTISSIPSTYDDLKVICSLRDTMSTGSAWTEFALGYNGGTTSGGWRSFYSTGTANSYATDATTSYAGEQTNGTVTANTFSNVELDILNYNSTATTKYFSSNTTNENNASANMIMLNSAKMNGAAAGITSLTFTSVGTVIAQNSTFFLYGIKNS